VDRVALGEVVRELEATNAELLGPADSGEIARIMRERAEREKELHRLTSDADGWSKVRAVGEQIALQIEQLEQEREDLERQCRFQELALSVRPTWEKARRVQREIESLKSVNGVSEQVVIQLRAIKKDLTELRGQQEQLKRQRDELRDKISQLPWNEELSRQAPRISALADQSHEIRSLDERTRGLAVQLEELEFELQAEREKLGFSTDVSFGQIGLTGLSVESLREPARELKRLLEQLETAKRTTAEYRAEIAKFEQKLNSTLGRQPGQSTPTSTAGLVAAIERTGAFVSNLRGRIQLARSLEQFEDELRTLGQRRAQMLQRQILPPRMLIAVGFVFVTGFVLLATGLFWRTFGLSETSRSPLMLIGGVAAGLALLMYKVLENATADQLDSVERQYDSLRNQKRQARRECERLDQKLPPDQGDYEERLRSAESELRRLEQLLPMGTNRQTAHDRWKQAEQSEAEVAEAARAARDRWQAALRSMGLSEGLGPESLESFVARAGRLNQLTQQLREARGQMDASAREQDAVRTRVKDLLAEAGIVPESTELSDQFQQLLAAHKVQQGAAEKRAVFQKQMRQLKRAFEASMQSTQQLKQKLRSAATAAGIEADEARLDQLEADLRHAEELEKEWTALSREMQLALETHDEAALILERLERIEEGGEPRDELERLRAEVRDVDAKIKELHQKSGRLSEQIQNVRSDRQVAEKQFEWSLIDARLSRRLEQARTTGVATQLLKTVHRKHEKDRQPETLREASGYLRRLTGGRFPRVWTPLAENTLRVDESNGAALPIELLSRGTREQVFLSLRLALVAAYGRRGMKMPMVLDDVLVNFDAERARCAAQLFLEFARDGHQLLVFTCHEHIREIFEQLGLKTRELPRRDTEAISSESRRGGAAAATTREDGPRVEKESRDDLGVSDRSAWKIQRLEDYDAEIDAELWADEYSVDAAIDSAAATSQRHEEGRRDSRRRGELRTSPAPRAVNPAHPLHAAVVASADSSGTKSWLSDEDYDAA
jgi:DNA repair exonuclease SbcCD ATPase subunit